MRTLLGFVMSMLIMSMLLTVGCGSDDDGGPTIYGDGEHQLFIKVQLACQNSFDVYLDGVKISSYDPSRIESTTGLTILTMVTIEKGSHILEARIGDAVVSRQTIESSGGTEVTNFTFSCE